MCGTLDIVMGIFASVLALLGLLIAVIILNIMLDDEFGITLFKRK